MTIVISLAIQGPLLPGTAVGTLAVVLIAVRGRQGARAAHSGRAGREPAARRHQADNDFRHPAIVAHEAASLHLMSEGRFDLGLGAGWYKPEYDAAGIAFDPAGQRIGRLEESLGIIRALLDGTPVRHQGTWYQVDGLDLDVLPGRQGSPRLMVGAGGPRMLRLAARLADVVGLLPAPIKNSTDSDDAADRLPAAFDAKIAMVREAAGDRFGRLELNALATFVGSAAQIRDDLHARHERFGLSYLVAAEEARPALTEIISGL